MPSGTEEPDAFAPVTPCQASQLVDEASRGGRQHFLWLRPDPSATRYEQAWPYALTYDGYAYETKHLAPEDRNLNDHCGQIEAQGWKASFADLRVCLFFLQRSMKWLSGSGPVDDIEDKFMACYRATSEAWEQEHQNHLPEVRSAYKAMREGLTNQDVVESVPSEAGGRRKRKLSPDRAKRFTDDGLDDGTVILS